MAMKSIVLTTHLVRIEFVNNFDLVGKVKESKDDGVEFLKNIFGMNTPNVNT